MFAFHNDPAIKARYLARLYVHQRADQFAQGVYWDGERGCAVGCTLHSGDHRAYETELGIPQQLGWIEDVLFEFLAIPLAGEFAVNFLEQIPVGADLSRVFPQIMIWIMSDPTYGVLRFCPPKSAEEYVAHSVITLYQCLNVGTRSPLRTWPAAFSAVELIQRSHTHPASQHYSALYATFDALYQALCAINPDTQGHMHLHHMLFFTHIAWLIDHGAVDIKSRKQYEADSHAYLVDLRDTFLTLLANAPVPASSVEAVPHPSPSFEHACPLIGVPV